MTLTTAGCDDKSQPASSVRQTSSAPISHKLRLPNLDDAAHEMVVLDEEIEMRRKRFVDNPGKAGELVERLLRRASIDGRLEDYLEADQVSASWLDTAPTDKRALITRATVELRLHRFDDARQQLVAAESAGMSASELAPMIASVDQAVGKVDLALPLLRRNAGIAASVATLSALAMGYADNGQYDEALALFEQAFPKLLGPSPIPIAAFLFGWGRVEEEAGSLSAARERYELAITAMPQHLEARLHLAGILAVTGDRERAIKLLEEGMTMSAHPGLAADLATLLASRDPARSETLDASAKQGWEKHVATLPEAFSDHAARYYLVSAHHRDPARALQLATQNRANRATVAANGLLLEAAAAAGDLPTLCGTRAVLIAEPHLAAEIAATIDRTSDRCPPAAGGAKTVP